MQKIKDVEAVRERERERERESHSLVKQRYFFGTLTKIMIEKYKVAIPLFIMEKDRLLKLKHYHTPVSFNQR